MSLSFVEDMARARWQAARREPWRPEYLAEVASMLAEVERLCDDASDHMQGRMANEVGFWRRVPGTAWHRPAPAGSPPDVPADDEKAWKRVELRDLLARVRRGDRT